MAKLYDTFYVFSLDEQKIDLVYQHPIHDSSVPSLTTASQVAPFCFPSQEWNVTPPILDRAYAEYFTFTLTMAKGEHIYGFCQRCLTNGSSTDPTKDLRIDVVPRRWESSVFITRVPGFRIFNELLGCVRVRRTLDPGAAQNLLDSLYSCDPTGGAVIKVASPSLSVACEYTFTVPRIQEMQDISPLFQYMTPHILHYLIGALLLERRVIVIGRSESDLSICIHGVISLLRPFRYPHIFVPILPHHLLQHIGAPSPYFVGILASQVDEVNKIHDLGDVLFIDLLTRSVRVAPGSAPVVPFAYLSSNTPSVSSPTHHQYEGDSEDRPWFDICSHSTRAIAKAFASSNQLELRSALVAAFICLTLTDNRGHPVVEDRAFLSFLQQFQGTQIYSIFQNTDNSHLDPSFVFAKNKPLSKGGYLEVRKSAQAAVDAGMHEPVTFPDPSVTELTSNTATKRPEKQINIEIAKKSFDLTQCKMIMHAIWQRALDSQGRNWKHGFKAMRLLHFLLSSGSEMVVAAAWNHLHLIHSLSRFTSDAVGVTARAVQKVRDIGLSVYLRAVELRQLRWLRTIDGHEIIRGMKKAKAEEKIPRISRYEGKALNYFAELHTGSCESPLSHIPMKPWSPDSLATLVDQSTTITPSFSVAKSGDLLGLLHSASSSDRPPALPPRSSSTSSGIGNDENTPKVPQRPPPKIVQTSNPDFLTGSVPPPIQEPIVQQQFNAPAPSSTISDQNFLEDLFASTTIDIPKLNVPTFSNPSSTALGVDDFDKFLEQATSFSPMASSSSARSVAAIPLVTNTAPAANPIPIPARPEQRPPGNAPNRPGRPPPVVNQTHLHQHPTIVSAQTPPANSNPLAFGSPIVSIDVPYKPADNAPYVPVSRVTENAAPIVFDMNPPNTSNTQTMPAVAGNTGMGPPPGVQKKTRPPPPTVT